MIEYVKMAQDFLEKHNATIAISYFKTDKHFSEDKEKRDIYNVTIRRNTKSFSFCFGDSIANTQKNTQQRRDYITGRNIVTGSRIQRVSPSAYDVLACLQKYEIGDFDNFCSDFGYTFNTEREVIKIKQIYFDVVDEYKNVMCLFSDCIDELRGIA